MSAPKVSFKKTSSAPPKVKFTGGGDTKNQGLASAEVDSVIRNTPTFIKPRTQPVITQTAPTVQPQQTITLPKPVSTVPAQTVQRPDIFKPSDYPVVNIPGMKQMPTQNNLNTQQKMDIASNFYNADKKGSNFAAAVASGVAADAAELAGNAVKAMGTLQKSIDDKKDAGEIARIKEQTDRYREMVTSGKDLLGNKLTPREITQYKKIISGNEKYIEKISGTSERQQERTNAVADSAYSAASDLAQKSQRYTQYAQDNAKTGVGKAAVGLGIGLTQMMAESLGPLGQAQLVASAYAQGHRSARESGVGDAGQAVAGAFSSAGILAGSAASKTVNNGLYKYMMSKGPNVFNSITANLAKDAVSGGAFGLTNAAVGQSGNFFSGKTAAIKNAANIQKAKLQKELDAMESSYTSATGDQKELLQWDIGIAKSQIADYDKIIKSNGFDLNEIGSSVAVGMLFGFVSSAIRTTKMSKSNRDMVNALMDEVHRKYDLYEQIVERGEIPMQDGTSRQVQIPRDVKITCKNNLDASLAEMAEYLDSVQIVGANKEIQALQQTLNDMRASLFVEGLPAYNEPQANFNLKGLPVSGSPFSGNNETGVAPASISSMEQTKARIEATSDGVKVLSPTETLFTKRAVPTKVAQERGEVIDRLISGDESVTDSEIKNIRPDSKVTQAVFTELAGVQFPDTVGSVEQLIRIYRSAGSQITAPQQAYAPTVVDDIPAMQPAAAQNAIEMPPAMEQNTPVQTPAVQTPSAIDLPAPSLETTKPVDIGPDNKPLSTLSEFKTAYLNAFPNATDDVVRQQYEKFVADGRTAIIDGKRMTFAEFKNVMQENVPDANLTDEQFGKLFDDAVMKSYNGIDAITGEKSELANISEAKPADIKQEISDAIKNAKESGKAIQPGDQIVSDIKAAGDTALEEIGLNVDAYNGITTDGVKDSLISRALNQKAQIVIDNVGDKNGSIQGESHQIEGGNRGDQETLQQPKLAEIVQGTGETVLLGNENRTVSARRRAEDRGGLTDVRAEEGEPVPGESSQRGASVDSRVSTGVLAESAGQNPQQRPRDNGDAGEDFGGNRKESAKNQRTSAKELGIRNGTERAEAVIPSAEELSSAHNAEELAAISKDCSAKGREAVFFKGSLYRNNGNDEVSFNGCIDFENEREYIRIDDPTRTPTQIHDHEDTHDYVRSNPNAIDKFAADCIVEYDSFTQLENIYAAAFLTDAQGNIRPEFLDDNGYLTVNALDHIDEEILCDARAGINILAGIDGMENAPNATLFHENAAKTTGLESTIKLPKSRTLSTGDLSTGAYQMPASGNTKFSNSTYLTEMQKEKISMTAGGEVSTVPDTMESGRDRLIRGFKDNRTPKDVQADILDKLDKMSEYMKRAGAVYTHINLDDVNNAKLVISDPDQSGERHIVMSCMVKNGEYPINFDFTKICASRVPMEQFIEELSQSKGIRDGENMLTEIRLTQSNLFKFNEILRDAKYNTACLGCFVETRRYNIQQWADSFLEKYNNAVLSVNPDATPFDFSKADVFVQEMSKEELGELYDALENYKQNSESAVKNKRNATGKKRANLSNEEKINELVKSGEMFQHTLKVADLITPQGRSMLHKKFPELESLVLGHYGSNTPKSVEVFTPYNNEILGLPEEIGGVNLRKYMANIAGGRSQSFSDFIITHAMDVMQKTADFSVRKLPAHTYTKVPSRAWLFGQTGEKHNLSVMFDIDPSVPASHAGLNADGSYRIGDRKLSEMSMRETGKRTFVQSFPWDEAVRLEHTPGYSKNCGIIGVGYSWYHNRKMLDDGNIGYIIGWHRSGMPTQVAQASHVEMATDYTSVQNNTKISGLSVVGAEYDGVPSYASWTVGVSKQATKVAGAEKLAKRGVLTAANGDTFDIHKELKKSGGAGTMRKLLPWLEEHRLAVNTSKATLQSTDEKTGKRVKKEQHGVGSFALYETLARTKSPQKTADMYIGWCLHNNMLPVFWEFADHPNYFNFIFDFTTYDHITGEYAPQEAVTMTFPDNFQRMVDRYMRQYENYNVRQLSQHDETLAKMYEAGQHYQMSVKDAKDRIGELTLSEIKQAMEQVNTMNPYAYIDIAGMDVEDARAALKTALTGKGARGIASDRTLDFEPEDIVRAEEVMKRNAENKTKFSMDAPVERVKNLIATHSLDEIKLRNALEIGGLPMPSIAISRYDDKVTNTQFGEISFLFDKSTIDPQEDKRNMIYGADAWTPTAPYTARKVDTDLLQDFEQKIWHLSNEFMDGEFSSASILRQFGLNETSTLSDKTDLAKRIGEQTATKAAFLQENGVSVEPVYKETQFDSLGNDALKTIIDSIGYDELSRMSKYVNKSDSQTLISALGKVLAEKYKDRKFLKNIPAEQLATQYLNTHSQYTLIDHAIMYADALEMGYDEAQMELDHAATIAKINEAVQALDGTGKTADAVVAEWVRPQIQNLVGKKVVKTGESDYYPSGNRKPFDKRWINATLDNIVDVMHKTQKARGESVGTLNTETLQAASVPQYNSIDEVIADSGRLGQKDAIEYAKISNKIQKQLDAIKSGIVGDNATWEVTSSFADAVIESASGKRSVLPIKKVFAKNGINISAQQANTLISLYNEAGKLPTGYFEAKPHRGIGFDEVVAAIVPDDMNSDLRTRLEDTGVAIMEYKSGDNEDRLNKINHLDELRFSTDVNARGLESFKGKYDYNVLVSKPDMVVSDIDDSVSYKADSKTRKDIVNTAIKNAASIGETDENGGVSVYVGDVGEHILLSKHGLQHGLDRRLQSNAAVTLKSGEILQNSIRINDLSPDKENIDGTYVLIGAAKGKTGNPYVVEFVVNKYDNQVDSINVLYSVNAKNESAALNAPAITDNPLRITDSKISIAQLLDIAKDYFPDVLSESVLKHYGFEERPKGKIGESALFSSDVNLSPDQVKALKKQVAALQKTVEKKDEKIAYYQKQLKRTDLVNTDERSLRRLANAYIKDFQSEYDKQTAYDRLSAIHSYIANGKDYDGNELTQSALRDMTTSLAYDILSESVALNDDLKQEYDEIRDFLKGRTIYLPERYKNDLGEYAEFKKANRKFFNVSTKSGTPIDVVFEELADIMGPGIFNSESVSNPADQIQYLADFMSDLAPVYENPYERYMTEAASDLADRMLDDFFDAPQAKPTFADKAAFDKQEAVAKERLKAEERETALKAQLEKTRVMRDEKIAAIKKSYADAAKKNTAKKEDSALRQKLLKSLRRLNSMRVGREDKARIAAILSDIDLVSAGITDKKVVDLTNLKEMYYGQFDVDSDRYDPDALENSKVVDTIARLDKKRISTMSMDDVRAILESALELEHEIRTSKKMIDTQDHRDIYQQGLDVISDIDGSRGWDDKNNPIHVSNMLRPETFAKRVVWYNEDSPLVVSMKAISKGQRDEMAYTERAYRMLNKFTSDKKFMSSISGKHSQKIKITGRTIQGDIVDAEITPAMRMSLYLHSKNADNMRHISTSGITVPNLKRYRNGKFADAYGNGSTRLILSKTDVNAIAAGMTDREREFADAIGKYYSHSGEEIATVMEKLKGYSNIIDGFYFPIQTDSRFTRSDYESMQADGSMSNPGWTKDRVVAKNPIVLRDANHIVEQSIRQHAKYIGLAIPVRNMNKLLNMTEKGFAGSIKEALSDKYGEPALDYVEKLMADIQGVNDHEPKAMERAFSKVRSGYAGSTLSINAGVAIKQAASYPTAAAVVGLPNLAKAIADIPGAFIHRKADFDLIKTYTPLLWYRGQGFSSQEQGDLKASNKQIPKLLNWTQAIDSGTVQLLWYAAKHYVDANNSGLELGTEQQIKNGESPYYKAVAEVYNRIIEETQPNYTTMQRNQFLRSNSELMKALHMFKTQPYQNFNILYDAVNNYRAKSDAYAAVPNDITKKEKAKAAADLANAIGSQLLAAAVYSTMQFAWDWFRDKTDKYEDDDGDISLWSFAKGMGMNSAVSLAGIYAYGGIAFEAAGMLTDSILKAIGQDPFFDQKFYGFDVPSISSINDAVNSNKSAIETLAKTAAAILDDDPYTEANASELVRSLYKAASQDLRLKGIPANNVVDLCVSSARKLLQAKYGSVYGSYLCLEAKYDKSSSNWKSDAIGLLAKAERMNNSEVSGKIRTDMIANGVFKDNEEIDDALLSRKKNDIKLSVRYDEMYHMLETGNFDAYKAKATELIDAGLTDIATVNSNMRTRYDKRLDADQSYTLSDDAKNMISQREVLNQTEPEDKFTEKDLGGEQATKYQDEWASTYSSLSQSLRTLPGWEDGSEMQQKMDDAAAIYAKRMALIANSDGRYTEDDVPNGDQWVLKATEAQEKYHIPVATYIDIKCRASAVGSVKDKDGESVELKIGYTENGKEKSATVTSSSIEKMGIIYSIDGLSKKQQQAMAEYLGVAKSAQALSKTAINNKLKMFQSREGK